MFIGPALYALLLGAGVPAWYDPWSDPLLAYDRVVCQEQPRSLESYSTTAPEAEASQEVYFEQARENRTSWWLQGTHYSENHESAN